MTHALAPRAVLFDLDGTLVDSLPQLHRGVVRLSEAIGVESPSRLEVEAMIGKGVRVLVERFRALKHVERPTEELVPMLVNFWAEDGGSSVAFYPGLLEDLKSLRQAGIKTAICTNKMESLTWQFLEEKSVTELFDVVLGCDSVPNPKPAPDMIVEACRRLGVQPHEAILMGDSRNDALAGRSAGVRVCLVETGYNEGEPISQWAREAGFSLVLPSAHKACLRLLEGRL